MKDMITVARKEFWELKHSTKSLLWLLASVGLVAAVLVISGDGKRSLVPIDYLYIGFPILIALQASAQIVFDSLLSEKKTKTLEVLLSTNISSMAIVMGKIIPAIIVAYLLSQISLLGLLMLSILDLQHVISSAFFFFLAPLLAAYLASCVVIITTIVIPDEKVAPTVSTLIMVTPFLLLARSGFTLDTTNVILVVFGIVLFSGLLTWTASRVFKSAPWITKL